MVMTKPNQATTLKPTLLKLLCLLLTCEGKRQKQKKKTDSSLARNQKRQLVELLDDGTRLKTDEDGTETVRTTQELPNQVPFSTTPSGERASRGLIEHESVMRKNEKNLGTRGCKEKMTSGEQLCSSLLGVFDSTASKVADEDKKERNSIKIAVSALLGLSQTAKVYAIQGLHASLTTLVSITSWVTLIASLLGISSWTLLNNGSKSRLKLMCPCILSSSVSKIQETFSVAFQCFPFPTTCHSLEKKILCLSSIHIDASSHVQTQK